MFNFSAVASNVRAPDRVGSGRPSRAIESKRRFEFLWWLKLASPAEAAQGPAERPRLSLPDNGDPMEVCQEEAARGSLLWQLILLHRPHLILPPQISCLCMASRDQPKLPLRRFSRRPRRASSGQQQGGRRGPRAVWHLWSA